MRNLKRALSLALAAAMLIGMMVVGASASYKDQDSVSKAEAVQLLSDLGIVGGDNNGNYNPNKTLTRAEFAVMMANMLTGCKFDATLFDGASTPFTDIQGHWAAPYIAYCYSAGAIAGTSATTYSPNSTLTTAQAGAILLSSLGYNRNGEFAANGQFALNVTAIAQKAGLYDGLNSQANAGVTRENVAHMIKNALFLNTKEYMAVLQIYDDEPSLAVSLFDGLTRKTGALTEVNTTDGTATVGGDSLKLAANNTDVGNTVVYYVDKTNKLISTAAVVTKSNVIATSTNGTAWANLTTQGKTGYIGYKADDSVSYYVNGAPEETDTTAQAYAAKTGVLVEFYDNDSNGKYDMVKITEYKLSSVTKVTAAKADGTEATVTIDGISGAIKESLVVGNFAALAEDDIIMVAKIGDEYYVYEPETFVGQMTAYNEAKGTITISGSTYTMANTEEVDTVSGTLPQVGASALIGIAAKKDATFYVDSNGYVVGAKAVAAEANYAVVDKIAYVAGTGVNASGYCEAVLVFADGSTQTVTVSKLDNKKVTNASTVEEGYVKVESTVEGNKSLAGVVYTYTVKDNKYELTTAGKAGEGVKVVNGVPTVATDVVTSNTTVFVVKTTKDDDAVFTAYTGFKSVPTITGTVTLNQVTDDKAVKFVYIDASGKDVTIGDAKDGDIVYVLGDKYTTDQSGDDPVYIFDNVLLNGVKSTITTKDKTVAETLAKDALYELTVKDGYVTKATAQAEKDTPYVKATVAANAKDGVLDGYTYDGSETVIVIDDGAVVSGTVESAKAGDTIYVKVVKATGTDAEKIAIATIYIVKAAD